MILMSQILSQLAHVGEHRLTNHMDSRVSLVAYIWAILDWHSPIWITTSCINDHQQYNRQKSHISAGGNSEPVDATKPCHTRKLSLACVFYLVWLW